MKLRQTPTLANRLCFIGITFLLILSCNKDVDTLRDAVLDKNIPIINGSDEETTDPSDVDEDLLEDESESQTPENEIQFENRVAVFDPIHDAYIQNGKGYNQSLIRLEEGRRKSYLMFDLSPLDSIGGVIVEARLEFVVSTDDGDGEVIVFKGESNDWTEQNLSETSAPDIGASLGSIDQPYRVNSEVQIALDTLGIEPGYTSLVLDHKDGDDLAFASKESAIGGSKLVVSYEVPVGTKILELENLGANEESEWDSNDEPGEDSTEGQGQVPEGNDTEQEGEEEPVDDSVGEEAPVEEEEPVDDPVEEEAPVEEEPVETPIEEETPAEEEPVEENPEVPEPPASPANEAPVAVVRATPKEGTLPLKVSFNGGDSSDDKAVVSYLWDFKNGETASSKNPEHTFTEAGTYDVVLKVKDEEGLSSSGKLTIKVLAAKNEAPTAKISANTKSGEAPLEVRFAGSGSSDDQGIKTYVWNFKDGKTASTANPVHTFAKAGTFVVELAVSDEEGLTDKETVTITVEEPKNDPPVSKPSASSQSGEAPVEIHFTGSNSTDDNEITGYKWDFGDGSISTEANPKHTFDTPGTYSVKLEVVDKGGLKDVEHISITVSAPENEAPTAVASASVLSGEAPLKVDFTGGNSSDDKGVVGYSWDFSDGTSSSTNPSHTFNNPGSYTVKLTVGDEEGRQDTTSLIIEVTQSAVQGNLPCGTGSGPANQYGAKVWCWNNISVPSNDFFSNHELFISSHCSDGMVTKSGSRLRFKVNPTTPNAAATCGDYNYRAEIREHPADVNYPVGTEQWWGFDYKFESGYKADELPWILWQTHGSFSSPSNPMTNLQLGPTNFNGNSNTVGELFVVNNAARSGSSAYTPTGIIPRSGQTLKVVIHMVWGDGGSGKFRVWINGVKVYDQNERTVYSQRPYGGYWKLGIYKWRWKDRENVEASAARGIRELNTSIGTLRTITRQPGDSDYGKDSYYLVKPD
ncbi:PKD domain-containing protein [Zobellia galactanivorans]|uniref:PKD domain-containing protein n=1 Tax=Zobellia galactanivorans (strain DSM 12802 / CCUG 47099 / CIP 106680 / NCIMB 13871 / Dsij) TaxID=63186 RepID=UPI0026E481EF|nr:PKD domain-containing protein [Zobellia galactanivorans]MDO6809974.1 PKD domain-containing protein [Zobellia galactanivorans]